MIAVSLNTSAGQLDTFIAPHLEFAAQEVARRLGSGQWTVQAGDTIEFADHDED